MSSTKLVGGAGLEEPVHVQRAGRVGRWARSRERPERRCAGAGGLAYPPRVPGGRVRCSPARRGRGRRRRCSTAGRRTRRRARRPPRAAAPGPRSGVPSRARYGRRRPPRGRSSVGRSGVFPPANWLPNVGIYAAVARPGAAGSYRHRTQSSTTPSRWRWAWVLSVAACGGHRRSAASAVVVGHAGAGVVPGALWLRDVAALSGATSAGPVRSGCAGNRLGVLQGFGPVVGGEGLAHLGEVAVEHLRQPVGREADAVVGDPVLREVVGANLL